MPGLASIDRETVYLPHTRNLSRGSNPMRYQESQMYLSPEEIALAKESFSMYRKPVELYGILKHRAVKHPLFLQRSLSYKIQEKRQMRGRIKMTVKFSGHVSDEVPGQNFSPLYVLLSSPIHNSLEDFLVYGLTCERLLRTSTQQGCNELSSVSFILPEIGKLSVGEDAHNLTLLFVSCVDDKIVSCGKASSPQLVEYTGQVLWGKVALGSLYSSWQKSPNLRLGETVDIVYPVDLHSSNLENSVTRLKIIISAQEVGPRDRSPYDSYSYSDIPSSSRLQIIHLTAGNVIFNYKDHNNRLQKTEVTEDFSCPFCLVRCASFKGLQLHLNSSHDLFNFDFWVTEDYYQAVNVSLKNEIWRYEGNIPDVVGSDIRFKAYFFRSRSCPLKRWHMGMCNTISIHHQTEKHSPDSRRLGLSQTALSKNTAVTTFETSTEIFPIGAIPSKEPSSLSIVRSPSSDRIISEGRNHGEQVQDGYLLQASPTRKANCQLDNAIEGVNNEESKKLEMLANGERVLPCERHQIESLVVDRARIADSLVTGIQGSMASGPSFLPSATTECDPQTCTTNLVPPSMLCSEKTRRLSAERTESRKHQALEDAFAPLKFDEEDRVNCALEPGNSDDPLVDHENYKITKGLLQCLLPGQWLNDDVINIYLELLKEREKREPAKFLKCHFFNTFFYETLCKPNTRYDYKAVTRWTRKIGYSLMDCDKLCKPNTRYDYKAVTRWTRKIGYSLMDCDKIFVPIVKERHWCLAIINMEERKLQYLDSLRGSDAHVLDVLCRYIADEAKDKTGQDLDVSCWERELVKDLPQQENGWDCGMFMIKYADFFSQRLPLSFSQRHMPYFRKRTAKEILRLRAE